MPGFYVGHGRHWDFLRMAGYSDAEMISVFYQTSLASRGNVLSKSGDVSYVYEVDQEFGVGLLMDKDKIASAFPHVNGGYCWPVHIRHRYPWPNSMEGQLIGSCHGARVGWFDGRFGAQSEKYEGDASVTVQLNALAYRAWSTTFQTEDQEREMKGTKAYMPLQDEPGYTASEDEIQFMSHVEEAYSLGFFGIPIDVYTITLALPDDFPMKVKLYTPRMVSERLLKPGEGISGVGWLFGSHGSSAN
jgi:hypothetical protein